MTKILILDDHKIFAESLSKIISTKYRVVNISYSVNSALLFLRKNTVDLIITDINLPDVDGLVLINHIRKENIKSKILVLTSYTNPTLIEQLIEFDIEGYLSKNTSSIDLFNAIDAILKNERYIEPFAKEILSRKQTKTTVKTTFTERELQILRLVSEEKSSKEISKALSISRYTVDDHRKNLLLKTNSINVVGLIKYGLKNRLI